MARRRRARRPMRRRRRIFKRRRGRRGRRSAKRGGAQFSIRLIRVDNFTIKATKKQSMCTSYSLDQYLAGTPAWDYYRVNKVVMVLSPRNMSMNPMTDSPGGVNYSVIDLDDSACPSSISEIINNSTLRMFSYGRRHVRQLTRPSPAFDVTSRQATNADEQTPAGLFIPGKKNMWFNTHYDKVRFRAFKVYFDNTHGTKDQVWQIITKLYVTLKSPLISGVEPTSVNANITGKKITNGKNTDIVFS
nr:MAG: capsid protein [Circoviridae sp.]